MIKKIQNFIYSIVIILIITKLVISNVSITIQNVNEFYGRSIPAYTNPLLKISNFLSGGIWNYTGFDTGYGFFGPNVGSSFIIYHELVGEKETYFIKYDYMFKTKEGKFRFNKFSDYFMTAITEKNNSQKGKIRLTLLNSINNNLLNEFKYVNCINTHVYLYNYIDYKSFNTSKQKFKLIKIVDKTTCRNNE